VGEVLAKLDWPGVATWTVFALASGAAALIDASGHLMRAWHQWRLDRRLARNPYMLREELNEYRFKIDDVPPFDPARLVGSSLIVGGLAAILAWLVERNLEHWWEYGHWLLLAAGLLYATWRWNNDPPETRGARHPVVVAFLGERDAVIGLGLAIVVVLLILFAVFALF
jgi:hypothetical protein